MKTAHRSREFIVYLAVVVLLAAGGGAYWLLVRAAPAAESSPTRSGPPLVQSAQVSPAEQTPAISQTGFVVPARAVELSFEAAGRVSEVAGNFEVGKMLEQGDVIARLDSRRADIAVARAEAELDRAEAQLMEAEAAFDRAELLEDRNVRPEASLEDARARRATARAAVAMAEAGLRAAEEDRENIRLVAPFDGVVARDDLAPGQVVQPGTPIGRLIDATRAEVRVALTTRQMAALEAAGSPVGLPVRITGTDEGAAQLRRGRVIAVAPELTDAVPLTALIVSFPEPFARMPPLRVGELVRAEIPLPGDREFLSFPTNALKGTGTVWKIGETGALDRAEVEIVHRTDTLAYVLADGPLAPDTRLLTTDLPQIRDGMTVRLAEGVPAK